jgi:hypothetical protein
MAFPPHDYVSGAEFSRYVAEEVAYRARIAHQLEIQYQHISQELGEIKAVVRESNGRTSKNTEAIAVLQRELEAVESEDSHIEQLVDDIRTHGCAQFAAHEHAVEVLGWSGKRKAAVAGGLLGGGALMWPALQEIAKAIHAVFDRAAL